MLKDRNHPQIFHVFPCHATGKETSVRSEKYHIVRKVAVYDYDRNFGTFFIPFGLETAGLRLKVNKVPNPSD